MFWGDFLEVDHSGRYIQLWFFQVSLHEPCTFTTRAFQSCDRILNFQGLCEACGNAWAHKRHIGTQGQTVMAFADLRIHKQLLTPRCCYRAAYGVMSLAHHSYLDLFLTLQPHCHLFFSKRVHASVLLNVLF